MPYYLTYWVWKNEMLVLTNKFPSARRYTRELLRKSAPTLRKLSQPKHNSIWGWLDDKVPKPNAKLF